MAESTFDDEDSDNDYNDENQQSVVAVVKSVVDSSSPKKGDLQIIDIEDDE